MMTKLTLQTDFTKETGQDYIFPSLSLLKETVSTTKFRLLNGSDYHPKLYYEGKEIDFNFALSSGSLQKTFLGLYHIKNIVKDMINNPFFEKCTNLIFVKFDPSGVESYDGDGYDGDSEGFDDGDEIMATEVRTYTNVCDAVMDIFDKSDIEMIRNKNYISYLSDSYSNEYLLMAFNDPSIPVYLKTAIGGSNIEVKSLDLTPDIVDQIKFFISVR